MRAHAKIGMREVAEFMHGDAAIVVVCLRRLRTMICAMLLLIEQFLNGLQFGLLLFLLAAGLTLVFGIMDLVNLAHGSLYMLGAYFAATFTALTGSFLGGVVLALAATLLVGMAVEVIAMRRLYGRDHLDHVLGTFGLILFFNELVRLIWGPAGMNLTLPPWLNTVGADPARRALLDVPPLHHHRGAGWSPSSSISSSCARASACWCAPAPPTAR